MKVPHFFLTAAVLLSSLFAIGGTAFAQRPPTDRHVAELGQFFNGVKIAAPIVEQRLAIYPVLVDDVPLLHGTWQTLDEAISRGTLVIGEKGGGTVPVVSVENRSKEAYILLMMGDVIKGGMQTRTVRQDTVLGPGQRLELGGLLRRGPSLAGRKGLFRGQCQGAAVDPEPTSPRGVPGRGLEGRGREQCLAGHGKRHGKPGMGPEISLRGKETRCRAQAGRARDPPRHGGFHFCPWRPGRGSGILRQRGPGPGRVSPIVGFLRR